MTGLDTNILVRYFAQDDPVQFGLARNLIGSLSPTNPAWIGLPVLLELVWAMTRIYKVDQRNMADILDALLSRMDIVVEHADIVRKAVNLYVRGRAEFADCLIATGATQAGCTRTVTFDRIGARDAGMELVA
jgi:predicted nucleic-acid-binding protein